MTTRPAQDRETSVEASRTSDASFTGYHAYDTGRMMLLHFEVFHKNEGEPLASTSWPEDVAEGGWYWWSCYPGCLPDGDPSGPFPTAEGAYLDAIND